MVNVDFNIMDEERGGGVTGESYIHVDYGDSTWRGNGCDYWLGGCTVLNMYEYT